MTTETPKFHEANLFTGEKYKTTHFLIRCKTHIALSGQKYKDDEAKIYYICSLCDAKTNAGVWAAEYLIEQDTAAQKDSYQEFLAKFKKEFSDCDPVQTALNMMGNLRQTGTAKEYIMAFRTIASRSGITTLAVTRNLFMKGLNPGLLKSMTQADTRGYKTMQEWYDLADALDEQFQELRRLRNEDKPKNTSSQGKGGSPQSKGDIKLNKLTPEERTRLLKEGRCFRCREKGHNAVNCSGGQQAPRQIRTTDTAPVATTSTTAAPAPDTMTQLRALLAGLTKEQKESLLGEGF